MKKQERKKLRLEKLRIARINPDAMKTIRGGSSIPTSEVGQICFDPP